MYIGTAKNTAIPAKSREKFEHDLDVLLVNLGYNVLDNLAVKRSVREKRSNESVTAPIDMS